MAASTNFGKREGTCMATQSKHFIPQRLTQGVFAAIATDGGAAICNSGLIDLGEQLVIVDIRPS
jgi:hypothetical protein